MKINVATNIDNFLNDFNETVRSFEPYFEIDSSSAMLLEVICNREKGGFAVTVSLKGYPNLDAYKVAEGYANATLELRTFKRFAKRTLYVYLSDISGVVLPYGSLTGIRPTKLYYDLISEGFDPRKELLNYYMVSPKKVELLERIAASQKGIYSFFDGYDAFANIPVCPTRCAYCSFIAETVSHTKRFLDAYATNVARDISTQFDMPLGKRRAIYVGGGTPTAIKAEQLNTILSAFRAQGEEFTVESGRPETLTQQMVDVLKTNGVTRVSVNPQTFKEQTLKLIGRSHTIADIYGAYERARNAGFDVNMDLIAMLPEESTEDFARSVDKAIELSPENITIHTLSIKRGSTLNADGVRSSVGKDVSVMVDYAYRALTDAGYEPYYMYRQKNTCGRLENVGYAKKSKQCVYNIDIMEETHTVHACGAGAISKCVMPCDSAAPGEVRIERLSEIKEVKGYNERIEELLEKKKEFFGKY